MTLQLGQITRATAIPSILRHEDGFMRDLRAWKFTNRSCEKVQVDDNTLIRRIVADMNISPVSVDDPLFWQMHKNEARHGLLVPSYDGTPLFCEYLIEYFPEAADHIERETKRTFVDGTISSFSPISVGNNCIISNSENCYIQDQDLYSDNPSYANDRSGINGLSRNVELIDCSDVFVFGSSNIKLQNCRNMIVVDTQNFNLVGNNDQFIYQGNVSSETSIGDESGDAYKDPYGQCDFDINTLARLTLAGKKIPGLLNIEMGQVLTVQDRAVAARFLDDFERRVRQALIGLPLQQALGTVLHDLADGGVIPADVNNNLLRIEGPKD